MNETARLAKQTTASALKRMEIPEGILRSCVQSKDKFEDVLARKLCLSVNEDTFEGAKQAINEYLEG